MVAQIKNIQKTKSIYFRHRWDSGAANKFLGGEEGGPTTYFLTGGGSTEAEPAVEPEED